MSVRKETIFLKQNFELFLEPFTLKPIKTKGYILMYLHQMTNIANTGANHLFSKKKLESCKISKANCFKLTSKQFLFSKCKINILRFILDKYSFTKLKIRQMREWSLKIIICLSCWHSILRGNGQYKGATLCLEGKSIPSRKRRRTSPITRQGGILIYQWQLDPFNKWHRVFNEWSSQIIWRDRKSLANKWVTMVTMKAELCKQIWEETYMGQLEWAKSQTIKMT